MNLLNNYKPSIKVGQIVVTETGRCNFYIIQYMKSVMRDKTFTQNSQHRCFQADANWHIFSVHSASATGNLAVPTGEI